MDENVTKGQMKNLITDKPVADAGDGALKRLDDGQEMFDYNDQNVEVARKMKAIEGMQPQINDMERRLGIMQSVEPVLENAIKTLQKVVDVRGMGKK